MNIWLYVGLGLFAIFLVFEIVGISTGWWPSLSATIYTVSKSYPLIPFVMGLGIGGLAVHFWGPSMAAIAKVPRPTYKP